jgi:predicted secreted hydrolase
MTPTAAIWNSPTTHASYPIAWGISIPSLQVELKLGTPLPSQELVSTNAVSPSYWEGAITVSGTHNGTPISGVGYLEMTGYAKPFTLGLK